MIALSWARDHWRPLAIGAAVLLAFAAGRYATPTKVITKTNTVTQYVDGVVTKTVQAEAVINDRVVFRDRSIVTRKDGTKVQRDIVRTAIDRDDVKSQTAMVAHEVTKASRATTEKTVTNDAPRLHVNVLAAVSVSRQAAFEFGGQVEYRVAGPIWVGAFGFSSGQAGVSVGVTF